ncbi:hypothetical protein JQ557_23205 [Bradyrhizobium sp. U87765 SZCCT0131]|uniref:hypothetical protein n=1 Tax=unclassified Bradyrhizobium TaxID=2631580 RepID=UPI001BA4A580|nr:MULTISPECIES: hypothetical protein [unclassified Bradyrhizobium]MBR1220929.1 hypothetical protein [Bradyrhizobium sp. U87765 SZCCT0131]MBR1260251.1 hypothetical protein [Bradyrhizobium sp. U87765 SZCCT0134]MBR1307500.1 hypothetical protein [Bradyrhizobium sp. U87765 SZCCT0110]MBR1321454.1 hypothetical protein [Bradyrhizobium sp. U87765 SZCCT0109]MBR1349767.1 hypothetical protein [Bradyrhizobium sp. U87765 SZCCT0048]
MPYETPTDPRKYGYDKVIDRFYWKNGSKVEIAPLQYRIYPNLARFINEEPSKGHWTPELENRKHVSGRQAARSSIQAVASGNGSTEVACFRQRRGRLARQAHEADFAMSRMRRGRHKARNATRETAFIKAMRVNRRGAEDRGEVQKEAEIIVFDSDAENAQFVAWQNAHPGDNPALPVTSMSTRHFTTAIRRLRVTARTENLAS